MAKSKSYRKRKQVTGALVVMSRMDYEIACRTYELLQKTDLDDEELSFLLGKRNKYFFELLNPTEKDKLKTEQLNLLPTILNCGIRAIIPNNISKNEVVKIHNASKVVYDHKIVYQHEVEYADGRKSDLKVWTKKLVKGLRKKVHPEVHAELTKLLEGEEDYFSTPRTALNLYLLLKKKITVPFRPADLQKSLSVFMRQDGKREAMIEQYIEDGGYWYRKSIYESMV